ncbi:MAG: uridine diphosphate-N-acetylglucosamine-binding protein YvcK [Frankiales bacterium]|nr:uridine diphosphate-N-acetylglucosamine-binding protein YvcK [Frankiales bacterium]
MSTGPQVVAFGGGHGLSASLCALRQVTDRLTAVVTVADDGGSSGRIRSELGSLPPGDLRMALAALAGDDEWAQVWTQVYQHRFGGGGTLDGHAVGNLVLTALTDITGDPVAALDLAGRLVGGTGRVLPLATSALEIVADVVGLDPADPGQAVEVRGQVAVATTPGRVVAVRIEPPEPAACAEAVQAVHEADWAVLGPGSWFTSVIPHLLVPDMAKALAGSSARICVALNLAPQAGETDGFSPETHLEVLAAHAPDLEVAVVLADRSAVGAHENGLRETARGLGARLVVADVAATDGTPRHDHARLAAAYDEIFSGDDGGEQGWR